MIEFNWTLYVQIANFLILIFVLNILLYKPIRKILLERKAKVDGLQQDIDSAQETADEKDQSFGLGIKDARARGQKEKEALLQTATEEEKAIVAKINDQAREDLVAVKAKIAQDTEAVKSALEKEVDTFADAITQKILGRAA